MYDCHSVVKVIFEISLLLIVKVISEMSLLLVVKEKMSIRFFLGCI